MGFRGMMRRIRVASTAFVAFMILGLLFGSPGMTAIGAPALNQTGQDLPSAGKVIVVLRDDLVSASASDVAVEIGVPIELSYESALNGFATTATQTEISKLAANPAVAFIAPDLPVTAAAQTVSTGMRRTGAHRFANVNSMGGPINVGIAILDTGVQYNHPDIRYAGGSDCTGSGTSQPVSGSAGAHGTHVAGIAAAVDNSIGVAGSAPGARVWNYKVLRNVNEGFTSWIICGLDRAMNNGDVRVINLSLAGSNTQASNCSGPDPLHVAVCRANNRGKLVVAAAGNFGINASGYVPAKYPEVLTVGNVADYNGAPGGDSYNSSSNYGSVVNIAAPGTSIYSTVPGSSYGNMTGTSMASPLVAGVAATYMAIKGTSAYYARQWVLSSGSVSQGSSYGCQCTVPSGSPSRFLYVGDEAAAYPAGTANPSFSGRPASIYNSASTPSAVSSRRAHDGSMYTNWHSGHSTPSSASLRFDLGRDMPISGVKWRFYGLGYADSFKVELVSSSGAVRTFGRYGNGGSGSVWYGFGGGNFSARYVRFYFLNPYSDSALGSISEVQIWSPWAAAGATEFEGVSLPIVASDESSGNAELAYDDNEETAFTASASAPTNTATFDLGEERDLTGVRWKSGGDDQVTISTSNDGQTWNPTGTYDTEPRPEDWQGTDDPEGRKARYVKVEFDASSNSGATADVNELEIWGLLPTGAADPDLAGEVLPITCAADPESGNEGHAGERACDLNGGTNWHTDANSPATATLTVNLEQPTKLTGVKWNFAQAGNAERFNVSVKNSDQTRSMGDFTGGAANTYEGIAFEDEVIADTVILTFTNVDANTELGYLAEVEVWSDEQPDATPEASPEGSPAASPAASPEASPGASPEASPEPVETEPAATPDAGTPVPVETEPAATPDAGTPIPVETETATVTPTEPSGTPEPVLTETATETVEPTATEIPATPEPATEEPTATTAPTETAEPTETLEPTATTEPTEEPTETAEPTAAISLGIVIGTDGDLVNCRTAPVDGDPISQLAEGDEIDVTGPAVDGWLPVLCEGQPGFIAEEFVSIGGEIPADPTATTEGDATATVDDQDATEEPTTEDVTEEATVEPTVEPTEEPVETPYPVYDTGDTENSGTAWYASDGDPSTSWSAYPSANPEQVRLYLDLGSVVPIDRLSIELSQAGLLPSFEIWLSEDAETWYNATPNGINGWNLWADEAHVFSLGYDARYIRIVVPNVDESGLGEVGGIRQIEVWAGDINETQYLTSLGEPTTPTPESVVEEPTEEVVEPTEEVVEEPTEEFVEEPTEEFVEEPTEEFIEEPTEEGIPDEGILEEPTEEAVG